MQLRNEWIIYSQDSEGSLTMQIYCVLWPIYCPYSSAWRLHWTVLQVNLNAVSQSHIQMSQIIACFSGVASTQYLFFFSWNHSERVIIVQNHFHLQIKYNVRQCDCMKTLHDPGCSMSYFSPVNLYMVDHKKYKYLSN